MSRILGKHPPEPETLIEALALNDRMLSNSRKRRANMVSILEATHAIAEQILRNRFNPEYCAPPIRQLTSEQLNGPLLPLKDAI